MLGALAVAAAMAALAGCAAPGGGEAEEPAQSAQSAQSAGLVYHLVDGVPVQVAGAAPVGVARSAGVPGWEPTLGVVDGTVFLGSFNGQIPATALLSRSRDAGLTWEDVTPRLPTGDPLPPMSWDPYVHVDADTGRVFLLDQQTGFLCSTLSFSDDGGDSWTTNPLGCGHPVGHQDHPTLWTSQPTTITPVGYPNLVHFCTSRVVDAGCAVSLDGGLSFGPLRSVFVGYEPGRSEAGIFGVPGLCGGLTGHGTGGSGLLMLGRAACGRPEVAVSRDDGLTWTTTVVTQDYPLPFAEHEVSVAIDSEGTAYAAWIDSDYQARLAISDDAGASWREPLAVLPPGVHRASFLTIAAGDAGHLAMAFHGTSAEAHPEDFVGDEPWHAYLVAVTGAATEPVFHAAQVTPPGDPLVRGLCGAWRCDADGIGDFNDVVIDENGRAWASFVDVCHDDCAQSDGFENEGNEVLAGVLLEGPRLRGDGLLPLLGGES